MSRGILALSTAAALFVSAQGALANESGAFTGVVGGGRGRRRRGRGRQQHDPTLSSPLRLSSISSSALLLQSLGCDSSFGTTAAPQKRTADTERLRRCIAVFVIPSQARAPVFRGDVLISRRWRGRWRIPGRRRLTRI